MPPPEEFLGLSRVDRAEVLNQGERILNRSAQLLEKDVWVCWALQTLFEMPDRPQLAFKGGTSLSKVFQAIARFSEDIDITVDYGYFEEEVDPLDPSASRSKAESFAERLRTEHLPGFLRNRVLPHLADAAVRLQASASPSVSIDAEEGTIEVSFERVASSIHAYVKDRVLIEFGARNVVRPSQTHVVVPYLSELTIEVPLEFPVARVDVLSPERTFWEKVTLVHAENTRSSERQLPPRFARHWYDLYMLAAHPEIGPNALQSLDQRDDVIKVKTTFFRQGGVDYQQCATGRLQLVPKPSKRSQLQADYDEMLESGMVEGTPPNFEELMSSIGDLESKLNLHAEVRR